MKIIALFGFLALSALTSSAALVNYTTNTSQLCPVGNPNCGANFQIVGDVRIQFNGLSNGSVFANPTSNLSYGDITVSCVVNGPTGCASQSFAGLVLTLTVMQTSPFGGNGFFNPLGSISGSIGGNSSSGVLTFSNNVMNIGIVSYTVTPSTNLVSPSVRNGVSTIEGTATVPEPATYAMLGSALLGLGLLRRRKA